MFRHLRLLGGVLALFFLSDCASQPLGAPSNPAAEAQWRKVLARVHEGMRRETVEKILGRGDAVLDFDLDPAYTTDLERNTRNALYLLDHDWCATIRFDSSGFTTRNNPHLHLHLPDNRVAEPPLLLRRDSMIETRLRKYRD